MSTEVEEVNSTAPDSADQFSTEIPSIKTPSDQEMVAAPTETAVTAPQEPSMIQTQPPAETSSKLDELVAKAQKAYSHKDYSTASDIFADACELQAKLNGSENHPDNAYLLYLYGKSLFQCAVTKSDVLGGVAAKEAQVKEAENLKADANSSSSINKPLASISEEEGAAHAKKPFFSFQGDENWDDSDEEVEGEGEDGQGEGSGENGTKEDDFENAWEIIDLARVLYEKKLREPGTYEPAVFNLDEEEKKLPPQEKINRIKQHLADCYDILGEISLESENWVKAKEDFTKSLQLKLEIFPLESRLISEAHYKLSLALEFGSQMDGVSDDDRNGDRTESIIQMERALESCKARLCNLELEEADNKGKGKAKEETSKEVKEAREIVEELQQRLNELRSESTITEEESEAVKGIFGEIIGKSSAEAKQTLHQAIEQAQDVTNLVRKKAKPSTLTPPTIEEKPDEVVPITNSSNGASESSGKRKLDEVEDCIVEHIPAKEPKKAKVEDATDDEEREGGSAVKKYAMA